MLKSCKYCGRIHEKSYVCPRKPERKPVKKIIKRSSAAVQFRNTNAWKIKREEIKKRDMYLCQICFRNLYGAKVRYNGRDISVHHAESLEENFDKRLDDDNLLTMCGRHHRMAEKKIIPVSVIKEVIRQQEMENQSPRGDFENFYRQIPP